MQKVSFYLNSNLNNKIFDLNDSSINRDNFAYSYYQLKETFLKNNFDFSTVDINSIEKSQAIIYNDMPKVLPKLKDIHKSYLLIFESELISPANWDFSKHQFFNKIFTWNDTLVDNKKYFKINFSHLFPKSINKDLSKKEKLCTLIAGHKMVKHPLELYSKRIEAIRWFEKHHLEDFDFYGIGWDKYQPTNKFVRSLLKRIRIAKFFKPNYHNYKGAVNSKKEVLEKYKFAICYENAKDIDGYITEKIFDCFFAGCIPIYWGANNITMHIPKECFIDKRNFQTYEELYEYINTMNNHDYMQYLSYIEEYLNSKQSYKYTSKYFSETIVNILLNDLKKSHD